MFEHGYHGGPLYFGHGGRPLQIPFDYAVLPYNDAAAAGRVRRPGTDIACVLVEPMLGSGGCIGRPGVPGDAAPLTADAGAVLIFDEVMTSRLALGGAQELLGITPT